MQTFDTNTLRHAIRTKHAKASEKEQALDSLQRLVDQRGDLLNALKRLLAVQEENHGPCLEVDTEFCEWCQARAAIAKATT